MAEIAVGVILNGVTGRMGTNQHLVRSILAIREQGGTATSDGDRIMPEPVLVGRNPDKLRHLSAAHNVSKWTTNLDAALADDHNGIYFDALATNLRVPNTLQAIEAGKAVYCEKPTAGNIEDALQLAQAATDAGVSNGVVQDKLFLPGLLKLKYLIDTGFFGRILAVRGEFGYWVFDGKDQPAQRPSWNYKKSESGGIVLDMFAHWRYVIDNLFGPIKRLSCIAANHVPERIDEEGAPYNADADDGAYAMFELENGIICNFNSSWCVRVRRDDLLTVQVDGTRGSAVRRPARMRDTGRRLHAQAGVEPGHSAAGPLLRYVAVDAQQQPLRQRLQDRMGDVPAPCNQGRPVPLYAAGRGERRAAGRAGLPGLAGEALDGCAAAE